MGTNGFQVSPGPVTSAGTAADTIGGDLTGAVAGGIPEAHTAATTHADLAVGAALTSCTTAWECHLKDTAARVTAIGGNLLTTARVYSGTDHGVAGTMPVSK